MKNLESAPLVSVIIPSYNRAATLARAMRSVLNQGYSNLELLIVDDGSTDNTQDIVRSFDDPRVRYLKSEQNEGASGARNRGLVSAKGYFVAFQDSDDEWLADKLQLQVDAAVAAGVPNVAVFHMKVVYGRDDARKYGTGRICCVPRLDPAKHDHDFVKLSHRENLMSPQTLLFSRSVLEEVGLFDRSLINSVDWDFSLRLVRHAKVVFIEEPLVMTYIQDDSISLVPSRRVRSQLRIILKLNRLGDVDPAVLGDHFGRIGTALGRMGKPRLAARLLRHAVRLAPSRPSNWIRFIVNGAKIFAPKPRAAG